ncbi:MAG: hypothetical protein KA180_09030 [Gemmatimonadales bacterium]|jgi:hypothetical protein|nr:hypothetical protein [Gemmatimonadales bacterium]
MHLLVAALLLDTLLVRPAPAPVVFDGVASREEYGAPTLELARPAGVVQLWLVRHGGSVVVAARMPDRTVSWGDDLVISLDTQGDRAPGPMHDDFQWYFRRVLDSSVVLRGEAGTWRAPRDDPDWRLGAEREGGGWEVRAVSDAEGWSLEFRMDQAYFAEAGAGRPGLAFRVFDDDPQGWVAWPTAPRVKHPTEVERQPALWAPVSFTR